MLLQTLALALQHCAGKMLRHVHYMQSVLISHAPTARILHYGVFDSVAELCNPACTRNGVELGLLIVQSCKDFRPY